MIDKGIRYCDCCGIGLNKKNNKCGYELCDRCNKNLEDCVRQNMIRKRLQLIFIKSYSEDDTAITRVASENFNSWKEVHIYLFENGLFDEFQVTDQDGDQLLHYKKDFGGKYELKFSEKVPGSVLFEIVNKHASAKL